MQTAVRKRAADFDFWGDTPTPEFCENSHERGSRSPAGTAQGFDPPLGSRRNAAGAARRLCRSQAGGGALAAVCLGGRGAGVVSPGRRGQGAVPGRGGRFRDAGSRSLPSGRRREAGRGRACPREAHKGRVAGAAARRGRCAGLAGADDGKARRAARPGRLPVAGARRATAREKRLHPARLV